MDLKKSKRTQEAWYFYVPIREFSKSYYLKSDEFDLNRLLYK